MRVAWMYHVEGRTQEAVAAAFQISRARVIRLLQQAVEDGLVRVHLSGEHFNCVEVAEDLKATFGLKDAVVAPTPSNADNLKETLGKAGALYLQRTLADGMTIATAWGTTLLEVARALQPQKLTSVSVVMMLGGLSRNLPALNPNDIARRVAESVNGRMFSLFAPALVDDPKLRDLLMSDSNVKAPLDLVRASQVALIGVGTTGPNATLLETGVLSDFEMQALQAKGAVGDILARFFDADGQPVDSALNGRVVGLELEEVRRIPTTVLVAGGESKVRAILGALRGGYVTNVITDEASARRLLELERSEAVAK
ncbi:MAG: sugar-binding transcriptional regulator [Trueperaceae bacterium]